MDPRSQRRALAFAIALTLLVPVVGEAGTRRVCHGDAILAPAWGEYKASAKTAAVAAWQKTTRDILGSDFADWDLGRLPGFPTVFAAGNVVTGKGNIVASRKHAAMLSELVAERYLGLDGHAGEEALADAAVAQARPTADALAEALAGAEAPDPAQRDDRAALGLLDRRLRGAQQEGAGDPRGLERPVQHAPLQGRDIDRDVRQLRHGRSSMARKQAGAEADLRRRRLGPIGPPRRKALERRGARPYAEAAQRAPPRHPVRETP